MPVGLWRIFGCPINEEKQWGYLLQYLSSGLSSVPSSVDSRPNMVYTTHETVQLLMVVSWRWTFWLSLIYAGIIFLVILFLILIPEMYTKALLEAKARQETGNPDVYATHEKTKPTVYQLDKVSLCRPWGMFLEPIVLLFSIYVAILYGILYLLFVAFPIIFECTPPKLGPPNHFIFSI